MKFKIITTALLFFAFSMALSAQEKYTYATVSLTGQLLSVSTESDFTEVKLGKDDFKKSVLFLDLGPLLKKVNEMSKQGWEVFSTSDVSYTPNLHQLVYHLRKKG